jgi:PAS domain S-box-containing protein
MKNAGSRTFIYTLLIIINLSLWIMLFAFQWEVSLRTREVEFFDKQLFPIGIHIVPLPVVFAVCALLSLSSIGVIIRDRINLAERKRLQTLLEQILESLETGVMVLDRKGKSVLTNGSARKILPHEIRGLSGAGLAEILGAYPEVEAAVRSAVEASAYTKEMEQNIGTLDNMHTVRVSTLPLMDRQGRESGTLVLFNDVSDAVALQRQMRDAERLSTIGTLAATLAHEIRNPLEALNLNLELLQRILQHVEAPSPERDKIEKYIRVFDSEVSRLAGVVENFLSFARSGSSVASRIHVNALLQQVLELVDSHAQSKRVQICTNIGEDSIMVHGFEDRLKQLFLNLIINGIEAMPDGGTLTLQTGTARRDDLQGASTYAVVGVQDTGEGIQPEKLHRLFEPFFSTRTRGTGLGLTIADRIAKEHGGAIFVESIPGSGSKFTVELPVQPIGEVR